MAEQTVVDFDVNAPAEDVRQSATFHSDVVYNGKAGYAVLKGPIILFFTDKTKLVEAEAQSVFSTESAQVKEVGDKKFTVTSGDQEVSIDAPDGATRTNWLAAIKKSGQHSLTDLTAEQQQKLKEFEEKLAKENISVDESKKIERIRFLKRKAWDIEQSYVLYADYLKWRAGMGVDNIKMKDVHKEVLTGKVSILDVTDKAGRPIVYIRIRLHERANSTIVSITQHNIYMVERALELAPDQQLCGLLDMSGVSKDSVDIRLPKVMLELLMSRYPNVFGAFIIVNQPIFFTGLWALVRHWMDADFASRINVIGDPQRITAFIDKQNIPSELGGGTEDKLRDWMRTRYKTEGWNFNQEESAQSTGPASAQARIMAAVSSEPAVEDVLPGSKKSGYINKESGWVKRFQRQFFVLKENVIYYFKDEKSQKPEGVIALVGVKLEDGVAATKKPHSFNLVTALRTYYFYLDAQKERDDWWEAITGEILA